MEINKVILNKYRIIEKIGEGGTAIVYRVYDLENEMEVALKVLKEELVSPKKVRHFKREAQAIRRMNHENIIKVFDFGDDGNNIHYIAQEYVDGMTLKEYIKVSEDLKVLEVVNISKQILQGLSHAHELGIIHKDIKSQNILIDSKKNIKITDFGIADLILDDMTRTQSLMGTPQYVAPETLNRGVSSEQTDIYSVGILLYELLTGSAPFTGEKASVVMLKQLNQPLPSILMIRPDVPQFLENIIIKASAKKLVNRYKNAIEMYNDLDELFHEKNLYADKIILDNDFFSDGEMEKTINLSSQLTYEKLKSEEEIYKKKLKRKKIIILLISVIIILIGMLAAINFKKINIMPELVGVNQVDAVAQLQLLNVDEGNIIVNFEENNDIEKDLVISTTPEEGEALTKDQKVTINVSSGSEIIVIEDYLGLFLMDIDDELEENGLTVETKEVESFETAGTIIEQSIAEGEEVEYGTSIELTVSGGLTPILMPNFNSLNVDEVVTWADENGITIVKEFECSDIFPKDIVINQTPSFNSEIYPGGESTITISNGECPIEEKPEDPADTTTEVDTTTNSSTTDTSNNSTPTPPATEN